MAIEVTPLQRKNIQERTVVYNPTYVNGMTENDAKGSYVCFYILTESPNKVTAYDGRSCVVTHLNKVARSKQFSFIKIGNFSSGSKSRWESNKSDLIKNDGNRSPAARYSQDILIEYTNLYLHFILVVVSPDTVEKNLEQALRGTVVVDNKADKITAPPGRWRTPISLSNTATLAKKISDKITSKL